MLQPVTDRTDVTLEMLATGRPQMSAQLMQQRRQEFFSAYMSKAKQKMRITFNDAALKTLFGS